LPYTAEALENSMTPITPVNTEGVRPKAYSYLRFSTPDQMEGDSFRRGLC
jgi:hypothetical protein